MKGKILLKAKKIGGLEESFSGTEDSLTGEPSDEDEVAEIDGDNLHRESVRHRVKVRQAAVRCFGLRPRQVSDTPARKTHIRASLVIFSLVMQL